MNKDASKTVGDVLIWTTVVIIFIGIILFAVFDFPIKCVYNVGPIELECPQTPISNDQEIAPSTTLLPTPLTTAIFSTNTSVPICDDFSVEGNGFVEACNDFIKIETQEKTSAFKKDIQFHNLYIELIVSVKRLDDDGSYSVILRRVDPCQYYDLKFSKKDNNTLKIELFKYFCNGGHISLNQAEVSGVLYQPYKLSVGIDGGEEVNFFVAINDNEELKIPDRNDFIWRGNFGLSVENGEVEFMEINLREQ